MQGSKAYGNDRKNAFGRNLKRKRPQMISYFNLYLTNEIRTTTRQRYTFLDALAFIGGIIDIVIILWMVFF